MMEKLKNHIAALPTIVIDGEAYLSYQAVTDAVAAFLYPEGFPTHPTGQIDETRYQRILETAGALCRELGYAGVVKLTLPDVQFSAMGLYWTTAHQSISEPDPSIIHNERLLFPLGQVVMTPGAANLQTDLMPYLHRHAAGDWGELDAFDKRQNDTAVKEGYRLLSAYTIPTGDGQTERIWIISEADRSVTTILLPEEY